MDSLKQCMSNLLFKLAGPEAIEHNPGNKNIDIVNSLI
jgi:hypothetical protein